MSSPAAVFIAESLLPPSSCISDCFSKIDNRFGAQAAWVGTRFVCATESGSPKAHQQAIIECPHGDTIRTLIFSGRPLRVRKTPYVMNWEEERRKEMKELLENAIIPVQHDLERFDRGGSKDSSGCELNCVGFDPEMTTKYLMGEVAAVITDIKPAGRIIEEMVCEAVQQLEMSQSMLRGARSRL